MIPEATHKALHGSFGGSDWKSVQFEHSFRLGMGLRERLFLFQLFWTRPLDHSFYLRQ
jgi:hypothetical protein